MKTTRKFLKKRSIKAGMPPGSLVHIGETPAGAVAIELIGYNQEAFEEQSFTTVDDCLPYLERSGISWVNVEGVNRLIRIPQVGVTGPMLIFEESLAEVSAVRVSAARTHTRSVCTQHH